MMKLTGVDRKEHDGTTAHADSPPVYCRDDLTIWVVVVVEVGGRGVGGGGGSWNQIMTWRIVLVGGGLERCERIGNLIPLL